MGMSIGNSRQRAEINMTPMIDVLLVLIIIFMVITPLASRGLNTLVPQAPDERDQRVVADQAVVLTVRADGSIRLNHEAVGMEALRGRLLDVFRNSPNRVIFVRGEADIEFHQIAEVVDIAKSAGLNRVALMTE